MTKLSNKKVKFIVKQVVNEGTCILQLAKLYGVHGWKKIQKKKNKSGWFITGKIQEKKRIPYNDAVEEALCFGWIDSTAKKIDEEKFAQKFTPRNPKSPISEMNKERVRRLIKAKKMTKKGLKTIEKFFHPKKDKKEKFVIAEDILKEIKKNNKAWKNFKEMDEGYKRVRIGYIESQRNHNMQAFKKSLTNFIKKTEQNKKFGMVQ